ncbi:sulfide:quinone oxidoreductase, mitochondrial-like [Ostrinia furnacalis]|uniref:sulfide:quinone oxidoreductase, mitochondrial-like n=1 Tax=Ostrinia furnacalis TaxID=93504 RepID=UPI0010393507|nr:sulfide:quinone oxidoreductase, mitochondrial-like [Ostrinia furnacalis]
MNILRKLSSISSPSLIRNFSASSVTNANYKCKLLVVGGGSGGCTIAAKFAKKLRKDDVFVLEPSSDHYYQPLWTLVGAGVKTIGDTRRQEESVLPSNAKWIKDRAVSIDPQKGVVQTKGGDEIQYEYVVIAVGLQNDYDKVPGLFQALTDENSGVSTIYAPEYCEKTWRDLQRFRGGDAIFTFPDTPIKCPGAPQKIAYLADSYFRMTGVRGKSKVTYNTCLPVIFGVKKYADALMKVVEKKHIDVNYKTVLYEVRPEKKEAVFYNTDKKNELTTVCYDLLHVTPPMMTPEFLRTNTELADSAGYLDVDKFSLQHKKFPNVYGIGDCTNTPNSKTAAAIAKQCHVLEVNLTNSMQEKPVAARYNGYGACPLLTDYGKCILAEFIYDGVPHETLPFDQSRESTIAYYMKKDLFPFLYWNLMLKGNYHGPEFIRKIVNPLAK